MFAKYFTRKLYLAGIQLEVLDPTMTNPEGKPYYDKCLVPKHASLVRLRCLVARLRMRKVWVMTRNGRFSNYKHASRAK